MIRFVDLTEALEEHCFAFYDTTTSRFLDLFGEQTWDFFEQFEEAAQELSYPSEWVAKCRRLVPDSFFRLPVRCGDVDDMTGRKCRRELGHMGNHE